MISTHERTKSPLAVSTRNSDFVNDHGRISSHRWGHAWAKGRPPKSYLDSSEKFWLLHTELLGSLPSGTAVFMQRGNAGQPSQSSEDSSAYPCFGGPIISLCPFLIVWSLRSTQCVPKSAIIRYWYPHWHDLQGFKSAGELKKSQNIPRPPLLTSATGWS